MAVTNIQCYTQTDIQTNKQTWKLSPTSPRGYSMVIMYVLDTDAVQVSV